MTSQPLPYRNFHEREDFGEEEPGRIPMTLIDSDGTVLYETEYGSLLRTIIRRNDDTLLRQYVEKYPLLLSPIDGPPEGGDVFWIAAHSGSADALRILLEHYPSCFTQVPSPHDRGFLLLNVASYSACPNVVRFLLDNQPSYADIHARDGADYTALTAAASLCGDGRLQFTAWERERLDRSGEVMHLLLDRGACPRDVVSTRWFLCEPKSEEPCETVLTLTIRWARPELIKRLIEGGADIHLKTTPKHSVDMYPNPEDEVEGVTAVFVGSLYANSNGIKVLFDQRSSDVDAADMVSQPDSSGRLPLHWAATNPMFEVTIVTDHVQRIVETIELLLVTNPKVINVQDNEGNTPLHYAAEKYGDQGQEFTKILKALCDKGADASLRNNRGETPLHSLCSRPHNRKPLDAAAIALMLEHGARTTDTGKAGNTALHYAAMHLHNLEAVEFLLGHGNAADYWLKNEKGNTPLHEAGKGRIILPGYEIRADEMNRAQDRMMQILEKTGSVEAMDLPNFKGETPRKIRENNRNHLIKLEEEMVARRNGTFGRGRGWGTGRGYGRGRPE